VDRGSEIVAFDFDERDPGMLEMLQLAMVGARRNGRHLRRGSGQLPEDRTIPGGSRHRFDQRQSVEPAAHHQGPAGGRGGANDAVTQGSSRAATTTRMAAMPICSEKPAARAKTLRRPCSRTHVSRVR
jgi:hypothetical protein